MKKALFIMFAAIFAFTAKAANPYDNPDTIFVARTAPDSSEQSARPLKYAARSWNTTR